jgi:hypothetical protein
LARTEFPFYGCRAQTRKSAKRLKVPPWRLSALA